jgi:3-hydroxyacyl-CoA dehydrogenase/enoyl-CoA hydratase/3-hydroxybutyryl-CoA epimerase
MISLIQISPAQPSSSVTDEQLQWRLVLPMVNEAARLLSEGVIDSTDAVDLGTVLGLGLAPFRGGLAHFADAVGTESLVTRLNSLALQLGPRFAPAPLLVQLAEKHLPLSGFAQVGKDLPAEPGTASMSSEPVLSI